MIYNRSLVEEIEKFIALCQSYDELYIYGAAENQELLARYLHICGMDIKGFLVSVPDGKSMTPDMLDISQNKKIAVILGLSDRYYNEIFGSLLQHGIKKIIFLPEYLKVHIADKMRVRKPEDMVIEINLADHCNLNCCGCDHFSQLAPPRLLGTDEFERDIKRLSELTDGKLGVLALMGGEPLLNKNASEFGKIARSFFPSVNINYFTNGLLLNRVDEQFWVSCRDNNCSIQLTQYPINIDMKKIRKKALAYDVQLEVFYEAGDKLGSTRKSTHKYVLDISGNQKAYCFAGCFQMNRCIVLRHGKIFACPMSAYIEYFNQHFNQKLIIGTKDYVDIYKISSFEEIARFTSTPVPFCRYCNVGMRALCPWKRSEKSIYEYILKGERENEQ